jgi:purine catabolism regulator
MRLLLSDALKIYPLSLSHIVAGHTGLRKEITSVNIVEVPEVARWMRGGELLFTSGYAFHGDKNKGVEILRDLADHQVTAMAIKPGKHLPASRRR